MRSDDDAPRPPARPGSCPLAPRCPDQERFRLKRPSELRVSESSAPDCVCSSEHADTTQREGGEGVRKATTHHRQCQRALVHRRLLRVAHDDAVEVPRCEVEVEGAQEGGEDGGAFVEGEVLACGWGRAEGRRWG